MSFVRDRIFFKKRNTFLLRVLKKYIKENNNSMFYGKVLSVEDEL